MAAFGHAQAHTAPKDFLKERYGTRTFGADTVNKLLTSKLIADAGVHTLEMQARGGVEGGQHGNRLVHLGADHNVPVAMAIKVGPGFPDRLIWAASSAETKAMHSLVMVPKGDYASIQAAVKDLATRPGGPPMLFTVDDMPNNNYQSYMHDLKPMACANDAKHGMGRIIHTFDSSVQPLFSEACADLARCFFVQRSSHLNELKARLQIPVGEDGSLKAGGKF